MRKPQSKFMSWDPPEGPCHTYECGASMRTRLTRSGYELSARTVCPTMYRKSSSDTVRPIKHNGGTPALADLPEQHCLVSSMRGDMTWKACLSEVNKRLVTFVVVHDAIHTTG